MLANSIHRTDTLFFHLLSKLYKRTSVVITRVLHANTIIRNAVSSQRVRVDRTSSACRIADIGRK